LPTKSEWGPQIGEAVFLHRLSKTKRGKSQTIPSESQAVAIDAGEYMLGRDKKHMVDFDFSSTICPECKKACIVNQFNDGEACPKCKKGRIVNTSVIY
jgi:hypothetical protein